MNKQKKALAVHDISCVGKCSLTVALPILSAAGVETAVLPTSVLSTHTGGFEGYTFHDLTGEVEPIMNHWESLGLTFDAIYTGYLGSKEQIGLMKDLFRRLGKGALKLVDPVMADNGVLYAGFAPDFPQEMRTLCTQADVIIPNFTEAALMLGEPYVAGPYTKEYIEGLLRRLTAVCPGRIVLTGVFFDDTAVGAASYDPASDRVDYALAPRIPGYFHGTGDVFGSALLAALLADKTLGEAIDIAAHFTAQSIQLSDPDREKKYGVRFEAALPGLMKALGII